MRHTSRFWSPADYGKQPGLCRPAQETPCKGGETEALPSQVGREHQKPRDAISSADLLANRAEEFAIPMTAVGAENTLANPVDRDRHQDQTKEKQSG